jgi:dolichol-phosphate mannosyltransferase
MTTVATARPRITIVTPVFNEAETLGRYEQTVRDILLSRSDCEFEILLVDDGSPDESWRLILDICRRNASFRALRLSRNFGSHIALAAALHHADGDAVAVLACDLQDPPEVVLEFLDRWQAGAKIVWGRRRTRDDQAWRIWTSRAFETLTRRYAMPAGSNFTTGSFFLIDRRVCECYCEFQERQRVTFAIVAWTGFDQAVVDYDRQRRQGGRSAWKISHMIRTAYDTFLAFSKVPFSMMTGIGAGMFACSVPFCAYLLVCWALGDPQPGWTSIMMALIMLFGLQFVLMSLLGEYLSRIYLESVRRPLYFISHDTRKHEEKQRAAA